MASNVTSVKFCLLRLYYIYLHIILNCISLNLTSFLSYGNCSVLDVGEIKKNNLSTKICDSFYSKQQDRHKIMNEADSFFIFLSFIS